MTLHHQLVTTTADGVREAHQHTYDCRILPDDKDFVLVYPDKENHGITRLVITPTSLRIHQRGYNRHDMLIASGACHAARFITSAGALDLQVETLFLEVKETKLQALYDLYAAQNLLLHCHLTLSWEP